MSQPKNHCPHIEIAEKGYSFDQLIERRHRGNVMAYVNFELINILPQPRKTFDLIEELAADVVCHGVQYPPKIAIFNHREMMVYLREKLIEKPEEAIKVLQNFEYGEAIYYLVLIDGERRYRALKLAREHGLGYYKKTYEFKEPIWPFHDGKVRCSLCVRISFMEALDIQISANKGVPVPIDEEAQAVVAQFECKQRHSKEKLTLKAFAAQVNISTHVLSGYLKFVLLPPIVKELVHEKRLVYGVALEIVRLRECLFAHKGEEECNRTISQWAVNAITDKWTVALANKRVSNQIENLKGQQFDLELQVGGKPITRSFQEILVRRSRPFAVETLNYISSLGPFFEQGIIPKSDTPLSNAEILGRMLEIIDKMCPNIALIATANGLPVGEVRAKLDLSRELIAQTLALREKRGAANGNG